MRQLSYFLMVGLAFTALQTTTVEAQAPTAPPAVAPGTMPPPVDISDGLPPADPCMAVPAGPDRDACYATAPVPGMAPPAP